MGKQYTIADMASYPWIIPDRQGQDIDDFPSLKRWLAAIRSRPATTRAYAKAKEVNPTPKPPTSDEERKILFGQDRSVIK
jgi:GST-like protein